MSEFWDDDWDYEISLWVQSEKSFDEFVGALRKILDVAFDENHFSIGNIDCEVGRPVGLAPKFDGVPDETYSYVISVPISTELIWSAINKSFVMGLALSIKYAFKCKYLITTDDDFFIAFSGSQEPLYLNTKYRPWSKELSVFVDEKKKIELSLI